MKRILTIIVFFTLYYTAQAQLNPIRDLHFRHWYECPNNFYTLNWLPPEPSADSLIGYNIYRSTLDGYTELYQFQTKTELYCAPGACVDSLDFLCFLNCEPFEIFVTAVYNGGRESDYDTTAFCFGFAIGVEELDKTADILYHPSLKQLEIKSTNVHGIELYDISGKRVYSANQGNVHYFSHLPKGFYILRYSQGHGHISKKLTIK